MKTWMTLFVSVFLANAAAMSADAPEICNNRADIG